MKRSGFIRAAQFRELYAYELHLAAQPGRWEVRINRGEVHSFLLGWLQERSGLRCVTLTPALGVSPTTIGPLEYEHDVEHLIKLAVDRWHTLRDAQAKRKAG